MLRHGSPNIVIIYQLKLFSLENPILPPVAEILELDRSDPGRGITDFYA